MIDKIKILLKGRDEFCVVDLVLGSREIQFGISPFFGASDYPGRAGTNIGTEQG